MSDSPALEAWLESWVRDASAAAQVERFVTIVDDQILSEIPAIREDPILVEDLHRSTRNQWLSFVHGMNQTEHRLVLPEQAVDLARSLARRGLDLGVLLKVYRAAHTGVFAFLTAETDQIPADAGVDQQSALVALWNRAESWMNDSIESLIENFYGERAQLFEGNLALRRERIDAILAGAEVPVDSASTDLGHPLQHWQVGYVVWSPQSGPDRSEAMVSAANTIARALSAPRPLTVTAGTHDLWCWAATPQQPTLDVLGELAPSLEERGLRVSVGFPAPGPAGFRSSHTDAREAQRLALTGAMTPPLLRYADVELLCLALDNVESLQRMVRREIGALCAADKNLALARDTALTYLTSRQNVEATAGQLFVHKNTVRYRLGRAEELLGHPLAERAAQVELALRYVALFGPPPD